MQIWLAFVAGLAGSFHCVGMCGGIVAALGLAGGTAPLPSRLRTQFLYNLGRVATYTALGALAGALGAALDLVALRAFSRWFVIGANLFVVAVGLGSALGLGFLNLSTLEGRGARWFAAPMRRLLASGSGLAPLFLGLLLGLLPCGMVYAPLLAAATSGGPGLGAATMLALGCGTIPLLLLVGSASSALSANLRSTMVRLAGLAVALMGAWGLWRALARSCCH